MNLRAATLMWLVGFDLMLAVWLIRCDKGNDGLLRNMGAHTIAT